MFQGEKSLWPVLRKVHKSVNSVMDSQYDVLYKLAFTLLYLLYDYRPRPI